jgi:hypothetical protein
MHSKTDLPRIGGQKTAAPHVHEQLSVPEADCALREPSANKSAVATSAAGVEAGSGIEPLYEDLQATHALFCKVLPTPYYGGFTMRYGSFLALKSAP